MSLHLSSDNTYWTGYALAPIPDTRDDEVLATVQRLVDAGPDAVAGVLSSVSELDQEVLRAFAERTTANAVRGAEPSSLLEALVALMVGGLGHDESEDGEEDQREALIVLSVVEDAARKTGANPTDLYARALDVVGESPGRALVTWQERPAVSRTINNMGYQESEDSDGFRYLHASSMTEAEAEEWYERLKAWIKRGPPT